jgi:transcription termination factor Rho
MNYYKGYNKKNKNKSKTKTKHKGRNKGPQKGNVKVPEFILNNQIIFGGRYRGVLEIPPAMGGYGFVRKLDHEFSKTVKDPFLSPDLISYYDLRQGLIIEGELDQDIKGNLKVGSIEKINDKSPDLWTQLPRYEHQTPIMPVEQITLAKTADEIDLRVVDLIAPIGKGQRAIIVAPPRTGKTVLLKRIAHAIDEYHPDIHLAVLLVDERPEEVTDFMRTTKGRVFASSNDKPTESHVRISEMALSYAKRRAEAGEDAVLLIDSLTRLGRAYNAAAANSGRTMSGGMDIRALEIPKKIFGSARKIEGGGSLTIIATCLVETNSRMDDLIFEEFKGTGNMELVLDRELANDRVFPAINIASSGTRNEERFIEGSLDERNMVRRYLLKKSPKESMTSLLQVLSRTHSNAELLNQISALA